MNVHRDLCTIPKPFFSSAKKSESFLNCADYNPGEKEKKNGLERRT